VGGGGGPAEACRDVAGDEVAGARRRIARTRLLERELRALRGQSPLGRIGRLEIAAGLSRWTVGVDQAAAGPVAADVAAELGVRHAGADVLVRRAEVPGSEQVAP